MNTDLAPLHASPTPRARSRRNLQVGVMGTVKSCNGAWCRIRGKDFDGWVEQDDLWGVYPNEKME